MYCTFAAALHIIGGDVRYECLGSNPANNRKNFRFTFTMYRDTRSGGATFDNNARFGLFRKNAAGGWDYVSQVRVNPSNLTEIPPNNNDPCILIPPNLGVQSARYVFTLELESSTTDYMVAYQRCCRNPTISNLLNPDETGAAFTVEITPEALASCNNSPVFTAFPPIIVCAGRPLNFDHSATDAEGDQIVYEFCAPLTSGGQQNGSGCNSVSPDPRFCEPPFQAVRFLLPGFSFSAPLAGDPVVTINPNTGLISGTPVVSGQFVVGVCIKEYRQGKLLSSTRRDFQFNVQPCQPLIVPGIGSAQQTDAEFVLNFCELDTIYVENTTSDEKYINTYDWEFSTPEGVLTFDTRDIRLSFKDRGTYKGQLYINKNEGCRDSAQLTINIFPDIETDFSFDYDTCTAGPVHFYDKTAADAGSVARWKWVTEKGEFDQQNPLVLFSEPGIKEIELITADINGCADTIQKQIKWQPVPPLVIVEPDETDACQPARIKFRNLSSPIDSLYQLNWDFGNGSTSNSREPEVLYASHGAYTVTLDIVSPIGCRTTKTFDDIVSIFPKPEAGFFTNPEAVNQSVEELKVQDQSSGGISWFWSFGADRSFVQNPVFPVRDTGLIQLSQIVFNNFGCSDTLEKWIDIVPEVSFIFPNAFTPNMDGLNEVFRPYGNFSGVLDYTLKIYNRWGQEIFLSQEPGNGWNGRDVKGDLEPFGQYLYVLEYLSPRREKVRQKGNFTLLR